MGTEGLDNVALALALPDRVIYQAVLNIAYRYYKTSRIRNKSIRKYLEAIQEWISGDKNKYFLLSQLDPTNHVVRARSIPICLQYANMAVYSATWECRWVIEAQTEQKPWYRRCIQKAIDKHLSPLEKAILNIP